MNEEDLIYICRNTASLAGIPVRLYQNQEEMQFFSLQPFPVDPLTPDLAMKEQSDAHLFYFIASAFSYYCVLNFENGQIVIGPDAGIAWNQRDLQILAFHCGCSKNQTALFIQAMQAIPLMPLNSLLMVMCSLNFAINHEKLELKDIMTTPADQEYLQKESARKQVQQYEQKKGDVLHNTYALEQSLLSLVKEGNVEAMNTWISRAPAFRSGILAESELRSMKNTFIVSTALTCRAAIDGGMSPQEAFTLSDQYIQQCEMAHLPMELTNLSYHMILDYTKKVQDIRFGNSTLTRKVSAYIQNHIGENLKTETIASALYLSRPYLSRRFHEETGMSLSAFIRRRKTEEAKRLLLYTNRTINDISEYLGYSSASHFIAVFTKETGISPLQYRMKKAA
jgi:AraC-like DNA-binding protein